MTIKINKLTKCNLIVILYGKKNMFYSSQQERLLQPIHLIMNFVPKIKSRVECLELSERYLLGHKYE